jgi:predicted Zn-dependent protease
MREKIEKIANYLIKNFEGDEIQITIIFENNNLTRFYESKIHQNITIKGFNVFLSGRIDKKFGIFSFTDLNEEKLKYYLKKLKEIVLNSKEIEELDGFASPSKIEKIDTCDEYTYNFSEFERVKIVEKIVKKLKEEKAYGIVSTGGSEIYIFNSRGINLYQKQSDAHVTITLWKNELSGWAEGHSRNIKNIDPEFLVERAKKKVDFKGEKIEIKPGEYPAILEFPAVGDVLSFMGWVGFSAKTYQEKRSFLIEKLNKKIFSEKFNLIDDPFNPLNFNFPFDFEGVPKRKIELVKEGIPINLVYDRRTAKKEGKEEGGNAVSPPPGGFPFPTNMEMKQGEKNLEKIIEETDYGIYITRFHYTNVVHPIEFILTGVTRDGTFLIENGKIKKPIKNLRFTDSFIKVFSEIEEISKERELIGGNSYGIRFPFGVLAPSIKVKSIKFTSGTTF